MFEGTGSYGNGAAMHVAPLGAYFADDMEHVIQQAELSSAVTHAHPEGIAGGIAVAAASSIALVTGRERRQLSCAEFLSVIIPHVPESDVRRKLEKALDIPDDWSYKATANQLGNGRPAISQKTVPFAVWAASGSLGDYQAAITKTASVGGDIDTNCAIVGGIVASYAGLKAIPTDWLNRLEALPTWAFEDEHEANH